MAEITLQIDGREVTAEEGTTVFKAAKNIGIHIPHLCYMEGLSPSAGCRLCLVEVKGVRALVASCSYSVTSGMEVFTDTERVIKARKLALELLLSDHPYESESEQRASRRASPTWGQPVQEESIHTLSQVS